VTNKSTKQEILDALNETQKRLEAAEKGKLNQEKLEKELSEARALQSAREAVELNIFSKELTEKYNDLLASITAQEAKLEELFGVGKELQKLALAIEAGKERIAQLENEKNAQIAEAKSRLDELNIEFSRKNAELEAEYQAVSKKLKTERDRESEEFKYNLARSREKENNDWEDEKSDREAELGLKEKETTELMSLAESKIEYIESLEAKALGFEATLESEKQKAVSTALAEAQREFDYKISLSEKDSGNAIARLEDSIKYLEKDADNANKLATSVQNKLDKAYAEMRDLASKTVESASSVKIIANTENKSNP